MGAPTELTVRMHTSRPVPALELIRRRVAAHGVSAGEIDEMQDLTWEWATASATAVHRVLQERAMAGAAHRADFLRSLVDGTVAPAVLRAEARNHGLDPRASLPDRLRRVERQRRRDRPARRAARPGIDSKAAGRRHGR